MGEPGISSMTERWRIVPSLPDYEVSDFGRVRRATPGKGTRVGKMLSVSPDSVGYAAIGTIGGPKRVHVLVAEAFLGPIPKGGQVHHRNENRADARATNLEIRRSRLAHGERPRRVSLDRRRDGVLPNIWIGASIENARFTWRADVLREIPAAVRFLSCEPLVGSLYESRPLGRSGSAEQTAVEDATGGAPERAAGASPEPLGRQDPTGEAQADVASQGMRSAIGVDVPKREPGPRSRVSLDLTGIDWVIVGGESGGRNARPMHPAWAREIREATQTECECPTDFSPRWDSTPMFGRLRVHEDGCARPALFFKQWGSWTPAVPPADQGVLPTDVCVSENGERYEAGRDYVCFPNESDGVLMRYRGAAPKSGGKRLDGVEWCEFPAPALALA